MAIGAAFGGSLGVTGTSGPGVCLKSEAIGLAVMTELPLVIIDVQRGGPSTGLPTKTEQADLLQAMFGRNGECPVAIVAPATPADCFDMTFEAVRLAVSFMTPVFILSDGYIANGAEPWALPKVEQLPKIEVRHPTLDTLRSSHRGTAGPVPSNGQSAAPPAGAATTIHTTPSVGGGEGEADGARASERFLPYQRDERLVRSWAVPGTPGLEHRIGGLEKQDITGNVSYDPANHEHMIRTRAQKVANIALAIPELEVFGPAEGDILVIGWGGTYGAIRTAVERSQRRGTSVAHAHLRYLNPMPRNTAAILTRYKRVLVPELNAGQLRMLLRSTFLVDAVGLNKVQGRPFLVSEIEEAIARLAAGESAAAVSVNGTQIGKYVEEGPSAG
jgi:2-oxoglutarate ferredoxin oxidoreductase subunit alpha